MAEEPATSAEPAGDVDPAREAGQELPYRSRADDARQRRGEWTMAALNGLAWSVVIGPALFVSLLVAILNNITAGPPYIAATYETRPEFWACPLVVLATPLVVAVFIRRQDRITGRGLVLGTGLAILLHVMLFGCLAARNGGGGGGGPPPQLELIE